MKTFALLLALWALPVSADIRIEGEALIYDAPAYGYNPDRASDANAIGALLRTHVEIKRIVLVGDFWITRAALDVARVVDDFELTTEVRGECSEACLYILVAGKNRTVAQGGQVHLKRIVMPADILRAQFEGQKASYGWADEFGQAAYMYDRAQNDMRDALGFLLDHGVSLDFAMRVFDMPRQDVWTPTRAEMVAGGVIEK